MRSSSSTSSSSAGKKRKLEGTPLLSLGINEKITLKFGETFNAQDLRLMEVPPEVIAFVKENKGDLKLIGSMEDDADVVLCTGDKTYSVKKVETSNAVFLVPPSTSAKNEFELVSAVQDYYESKPIEARTDKIASILKDSLYEGETADAESMDTETTVLLSRHELEQQVQASAAELDAALDVLGVVEVRGKMRMLCEHLRRAATRELLDTMMIQRWDATKLDEAICRQHMPDTDTIYLSHALGSLGTPHAESKPGNAVAGCQIWTLDACKVAQATAHILFQNRPKSDEAWPAADFMLEWGARCPDMGGYGTTTTMSGLDKGLLAGIAVGVVGSGKEELYRYVPAHTVNILPKAEERFKHLATIKLKYSEAELSPYCKGLYGGPAQPRSVPELLLKHCKFVDSMYIIKQ